MFSQFNMSWVSGEVSRSNILQLLCVSDLSIKAIDQYFQGHSIGCLFAKLSKDLEDEFLAWLDHFELIKIKIKLLDGILCLNSLMILLMTFVTIGGLSCRFSEL